MDNKVNDTTEAWYNHEELEHVWEQGAEGQIKNLREERISQSAVYFGNHMNGTIILFEKNTELFKVNRFCTADGSKTTAENVSTNRLYKVALCRITGIIENGTDIQLQCTTVMYRVIHKSLRDFRTRLRNNHDRHGRKEHINR